MRIACARRDGQWVNLSSGAESRVTLQPEGANVCFKYFKYPLHNVKGTITWIPARETTEVKAIAYARQRPVTIEGSWRGHGDQVSSSFDISAEDILIEPALIAALLYIMAMLSQPFAGPLAIEPAPFETSLHTFDDVDHGN